MSFGVSDTTTDDYFQVYNETVPHGMLRCTSIKNVGPSNNMTIKLSATDAYGTVATPVEYVILPGLSKVFTSFDAGLGLVAPWETMKLEVKSTISSMPTDYDCQVANV